MSSTPSRFRSPVATRTPPWNVGSYGKNEYRSTPVLASNTRTGCAIPGPGAVANSLSRPATPAMLIVTTAVAKDPVSRFTARYVNVTSPKFGSKFDGAMNVKLPFGSNALVKPCQNVLNEVEKIETERKTRIIDIKIGELQISKHDLQLKNLILMGNQFFYLGEYDKAIECYDKILQMNVRYFEAVLNRAFTLNKLDRFSEALDWYDKALRIHPKHVTALNNKGEIFLQA